MQKVVDILDKIAGGIGKIVSLTIVVMVLSVTLEIWLRLFTGRPLVWTYETSLFLFGGYIMLMGGYAYVYGSHVRVDLLYSRGSPKTKAILDLITFPLVLLFVGVILWLSLAWAYDAWEYNERSQTLWSPILLPIKATVPLGAFLMLIAGISKFIKDLRQLVKSERGRANGSTL
jgi:TRAP-type mannitol/chloroaromatic compound transport system permease small subunit